MTTTNLWDRFWNYVTFQVTQELTNGFLTVLGIQMILALVVFMLFAYERHKYEQRRKRIRYIQVHESFIDRRDVRISIAWIVFIAGFTLRAAYNWLLRSCQNAGELDCSAIEANYPLIFVATGFAVIGGVYTMKQLLPLHWTPWSVVVPVFVSALIPLVWRYLV